MLGPARVGANRDMGLENVFTEFARRLLPCSNVPPHPGRAASICWNYLRFSPVASHHPVAQHLVRRLDHIGIDSEFLTAGILSNEFQAELKILELLRAQIANRPGLLKRQGN